MLFMLPVSKVLHLKFWLHSWHKGSASAIKLVHQANRGFKELQTSFARKLFDIDRYLEKLKTKKGRSTKNLTVVQVGKTPLIFNDPRPLM